uniref:Glucagon / GIP / secretin / VIP family domain-containing protein n=1 Tax=Haplochromis burtoni TaxID=8153 RepID=A0A3Q2W7Z5_HAPBU
PPLVSILWMFGSILSLLLQTLLLHFLSFSGHEGSRNSNKYDITLKRHSDGTFTSDFTHYLDKIKAKDFVEWLTDPKQEG